MCAREEKYSNGNVERTWHEAISNHGLRRSMRMRMTQRGTGQGYES